MPVDPNRASFVQQEFRYETAEDLTIRAVYPAAREYIHATNLMSDAAAALAAAMLAENSEPASVYRVAVKGTYTLDDIAGGPLRFMLDFPRHGTDDRAYKVTRFETDHYNNTTTLEVRG